MMTKYDDFLLEKTIITLINEGELIGASNFLDRVERIRKNKIANALKFLFNGFDTDENLPQNYIEIDGEDKVTFLSDVKADKIFSDGYYDESRPFLAKGRNSVKIGRFVKTLFKITDVLDELGNMNDNEKPILPLRDKDIEEFVNAYKATDYDDKKKFKIVKGADINKWYSEKKYANERGQLGNSCMKDVDSNFFDLYAENNACSLLIYANEERKLFGRALVWKLSTSPCEAKYFMDRIYTASDSDITKFKDYADENGWMYKYKMNSDDEDSLLFYYKGQPVIGRISVELKNSKYDEYPYLDTLTFFDGNSTISNVGFVDGKMLDGTGGEFGVCSSCRGKGLSNCFMCRGKGEVDCNYCDGDKTVDCNKCDNITSDIKKKCTKCGGVGETKCEECKGTGKEICDRCNGETSCADCVGLEKAVRNKIKTEGYAPEFKKIL